uniref:Phosphatidylinositol-specific phospholipase C X domain-containing protein n=1 Tax=Chromera velia CCMP2878 TaxID=1169474 RepID=A0A0G4GD34_9ALVE|eukprot:Cvel_21338.t1-p1 / transcript=Cvel_21338.t1 / gene=Cvel_21338 / organism=Chromera_velia_CCMP2878 / gene_product=1-phosphatidylinositol phosphodiesterase, putative / transcript_product=1-phosphatidylinositol phosphodiesterase, putative / location=Cvel_scaffold1991:4293-7982(-) / protein_length=515 / sequence_SO=supercontig / SO=protein_coding / is_pseudo=false
MRDTGWRNGRRPSRSTSVGLAVVLLLLTCAQSNRDEIPFWNFPLIMAHDAGTGYLEYKKMNPAVRWSKTQKEGVTSQLNCGARAFDIRPRVTETGEVIMHHTVSIYKPVVDVVAEAIDWLSQHPQEMVVMYLSHFEGPRPKSSGRSRKAALSVSREEAKNTTISVLEGRGLRVITECVELHGLTYGEVRQLPAARLPSGGSLLVLADCVHENWDPSVKCYGRMPKRALGGPEMTPEVAEALPDERPQGAGGVFPSGEVDLDCLEADEEFAFLREGFTEGEGGGREVELEDAIPEEGTFRGTDVGSRRGRGAQDIAEVYLAEEEEEGGESYTLSQWPYTLIPRGFFLRQLELHWKTRGAKDLECPPSSSLPLTRAEALKRKAVSRSGLYSCWYAPTRHIPYARLKGYMRKVSGTFHKFSRGKSFVPPWILQLHWQYDMSSVCAGLSCNSSILLDVVRSKVNVWAARHVADLALLPALNFLQVDDVCAAEGGQLLSEAVELRIQRLEILGVVKESVH